MKSIRDALSQREGEEIYSVSPEDSVYSAAVYMTAKNIGAVAVLRQGKLIGLISERDIMTEVIAKETDPSRVNVSDVMTTKLVIAGPDESCEECSVKMKMANCRHIPVMDSGRFIGMISLRDILSLDLMEKKEEVERLDNYVWRTPQRPEV